MIRPRCIAVLIAAMVSFAGCGDSGPKYVTVSGQVLLTTGQTVPNGYVSFHPDTAKGNTSKIVAIGFIQEGRYSIKSGDRDGVLPGWYKVTVDAAAESDPNRPRAAVWIADKRYTDKERSKLTIEVTESAATGAYDLKLSPPANVKK